MQNISVSDFNFRPAGHGHFDVYFQSRKTGKTWKSRTADMPLIDATKNADNPKIKDLQTLKRVCKSGNWVDEKMQYIL